MLPLVCYRITRYTTCGAIQSTFIFIHRESKPYIGNRVTMDGSTFFVFVILSEPRKEVAPDTNSGRVLWL